MKIWDWFLKQFDKNNDLKLNAYVGQLSGEIFYKELAVQACKNLIASTIARAEWQTFENGKEVRKDNYYLFNVEPNPNYSATEFWTKVISKLVDDNEALVVQEDGHFYVADSFTMERYALRDNIYKSVYIDGLLMNKTYFEPQVFYFKLHDERIRNVIDGLYESYGKLVKATEKQYKRSKSHQGFLNIGTQYPQTDEKSSELKELLGNRFKDFFNAEGDAIIPLSEGLSYDEPGKEGSGGKSAGGSREIRNLVDDIIDYTCMAFQISPQLIKGGVTNLDKAWDDFLTVPIGTITKILQDEINRKYYKKAAYLHRTYAKLDTTRIKAVNIKDIANALDILTRIGAYSVDDSLKTLGMEPLNTSWSQARWMTKNYQIIEEAVKGEGSG